MVRRTCSIGDVSGIDYILGMIMTVCSAQPLGCGDATSCVSTAVASLLPDEVPIICEICGYAYLLVLWSRLAVAFHNPFIGCQFTQCHRATGMQLLRAHGNLGTQAQLRSIVEAR